ncbi:hypothetical protein [Paenarthrobacter sp. YJN-5]|uniref:hypothetical protein n=1 Tax=Paenarthrobacter sp. YJN-5 TaxID=2735316 RepID=UPI0018782DCA|nr:hypothetical protein [Paenarthrobacter sp. YJN-5]QOT16773.1 hypothetical protein HMI59_09285 [Paenarthrobacter sp. YJN-5]
MGENKQITPLDVEIDEIGLSVLGWEIFNFQARLVMKEYRRSDVLYQVAASAEVRFHPDDWQVRYDASNLSEGEYLSPIVWQLRSRSRGALMSYQEMILSLKKKEVRAPKMVSASMEPWEGKGMGDPRDLYVWVGGVDWEEIDGWHSKPSFEWRDMPCEIVDYTTSRGVKIDVKEYSARLRDSKKLEVSVRAIHPLGSAEVLFAAFKDSEEFYGDPYDELDEQEDFVVQAPDVFVNVFDASGFLLDQRETSNYRWVTVGTGGAVPRRYPSFIQVVAFDLDDFAGDPARIVIRIQDPS